MEGIVKGSWIVDTLGLSSLSKSMPKHLQKVDETQDIRQSLDILIGSRLLSEKEQPTEHQPNAISQSNLDPSIWRDGRGFVRDVCFCLPSVKVRSHGEVSCLWSCLLWVPSQRRQAPEIHRDRSPVSRWKGKKHRKTKGTSSETRIIRQCLPFTTISIDLSETHHARSLQLSFTFTRQRQTCRLHKPTLSLSVALAAQLSSSEWHTPSGTDSLQKTPSQTTMATGAKRSTCEKSGSDMQDRWPRRTDMVVGGKS